MLEKKNRNYSNIIELNMHYVEKILHVYDSYNLEGS